MLLSAKNVGPNPLNLSTDAVAGGRAATIASEASWSVQDAFHFLHSTEVVRTGASAQHAITSVGQAIATSAAGILGVAAGTGISAYVNHLVHGHHEKSVTDDYREQIATITGKSEDNVDVSDLYSVARSNPSLDEELDRNRGMRNLRTAATLLATSVAFIAVIGAATLFPPLAALGAAAASSGIISMAGAGFITASMAISYGVMHTVGKGITKMGKKLLGYDRPNVADHVTGLDKLVEDGQHLSAEKVMGVFVSASPQMQQQIQQNFGNSYDKLDTPQQVEAERMFGNHLPLEQLAEAINTKQMDPRELIFTVHGQTTGMAPPIAPTAAVAQQQSQLQVAQQQQQPEQAALSQAQANAPITANQWRDLVERQRAEQGINAPTL